MGGQRPFAGAFCTQAAPAHSAWPSSSPNRSAPLPPAPPAPLFICTPPPPASPAPPPSPRTSSPPPTARWRVRGPAGTGSVGRGVGEGRSGNARMRTHLSDPPLCVWTVAAICMSRHFEFPFCPLRLLGKFNTTGAAPHTQLSYLLQLLAWALWWPSPTPRPTDPVPRGLLTLCPGAY